MLQKLIKFSVSDVSDDVFGAALINIDFYKLGLQTFYLKI